MILPSPATQEICTRNSTKRDTQQVLVNFVRLMNRCYYSPDFVAGWKETGSIYLARTEDRLMYYKRSLASAKYLMFLIVDPFAFFVRFVFVLSEYMALKMERFGRPNK